MYIADVETTCEVLIWGAITSVRLLLQSYQPQYTGCYIKGYEKEIVSQITSKQM